MTVINMLRAKTLFRSTPDRRHILYHILLVSSDKKIHECYHEKGCEVLFQFKLYQTILYPTSVPVIFSPNNIFLPV